MQSTRNRTARKSFPRGQEINDLIDSHPDTQLLRRSEDMAWQQNQAYHEQSPGYQNYHTVQQQQQQQQYSYYGQQPYQPQPYYHNQHHQQYNNHHHQQHYEQQYSNDNKENHSEHHSRDPGSLGYYLDSPEKKKRSFSPTRRRSDTPPKSSHRKRDRWLSNSPVSPKHTRSPRSSRSRSKSPKRSRSKSRKRSRSRSRKRSRSRSRKRSRSKSPRSSRSRSRSNKQSKSRSPERESRSPRPRRYSQSRRSRSPRLRSRSFHNKSRLSTRSPWRSGNNRYRNTRSPYRNLTQMEFEEKRSSSESSRGNTTMKSVISDAFGNNRRISPEQSSRAEGSELLQTKQHRTDLVRSQLSEYEGKNIKQYSDQDSSRKRSHFRRWNSPSSEDSSTNYSDVDLKRRRYDGLKSSNITDNPYKWVNPKLQQTERTANNKVVDLTMSPISSEEFSQRSGEAESEQDEMESIIDTDNIKDGINNKNNDNAETDKECKTDQSSRGIKLTTKDTLRTGTNEKESFKGKEAEVNSSTTEIVTEENKESQIDSIQEDKSETDKRTNQNVMNNDSSGTGKLKETLLKLRKQGPFEKLVDTVLLAKVFKGKDEAAPVGQKEKNMILTPDAAKGQTINTVEEHQNVDPVPNSLKSSETNADCSSKDNCDVKCSKSDNGNSKSVTAGNMTSEYQKTTDKQSDASPEKPDKQSVACHAKSSASNKEINTHFDMNEHRKSPLPYMSQSCKQNQNYYFSNGPLNQFSDQKKDTCVSSKQDKRLSVNNVNADLGKRESVNSVDRRKSAPTDLNQSRSHTLSVRDKTRHFEAHSSKHTGKIGNINKDINKKNEPRDDNLIENEEKQISSQKEKNTFLTKVNEDAVKEDDKQEKNNSAQIKVAKQCEVYLERCDRSKKTQNVKVIPEKIKPHQYERKPILKEKSGQSNGKIGQETEKNVRRPSLSNEISEQDNVEKVKEGVETRQNQNNKRLSLLKDKSEQTNVELDIEMGKSEQNIQRSLSNENLEQNNLKIVQENDQSQQDVKRSSLSKQTPEENGKLQQDRLSFLKEKAEPKNVKVVHETVESEQVERTLISQERRTSETERSETASLSKERRPSGTARPERASLSKERRPSGTERPERASLSKERRPSGTERLERASLSKERRQSGTERPERASLLKERRPSETERPERASLLKERRPSGTERPERASLSKERRPSGTERPERASLSKERRPSGTERPERASLSKERRPSGTERPERASLSKERRPSGTERSEQQRRSSITDTNQDKNCHKPYPEDSDKQQNNQEQLTSPTHVVKGTMNRPSANLFIPLGKSTHGKQNNAPNQRFSTDMSLSRQNSTLSHEIKENTIPEKNRTPKSQPKTREIKDSESTKRNLFSKNAPRVSHFSKDLTRVPHHSKLSPSKDSKHPFKDFPLHKGAKTASPVKLKNNVPLPVGHKTKGKLSSSVNLAGSKKQTIFSYAKSGEGKSFFSKLGSMVQKKENQVSKKDPVNHQIELKPNNARSNEDSVKVPSVSEKRRLEEDNTDGEKRKRHKSGKENDEQSENPNPKTDKGHVSSETKLDNKVIESPGFKSDSNKNDSKKSSGTEDEKEKDYTGKNYRDKKSDFQKQRRKSGINDEMMTTENCELKTGKEKHSDIKKDKIKYKNDRPENKEKDFKNLFSDIRVGKKENDQIDPKPVLNDSTRDGHISEKSKTRKQLTKNCTENASKLCSEKHIKVSESNSTNVGDNVVKEDNKNNKQHLKLTECKDRKETKTLNKGVSEKNKDDQDNTNGQIGKENVSESNETPDISSSEVIDNVQMSQKPGVNKADKDIKKCNLLDVANNNGINLLGKNTVDIPVINENTENESISLATENSNKNGVARESVKHFSVTSELKDAKSRKVPLETPTQDGQKTCRNEEKNKTNISGETDQLNGLFGKDTQLDDLEKKDTENKTTKMQGVHLNLPECIPQTKKRLFRRDSADKSTAVMNETNSTDTSNTKPMEPDGMKEQQHLEKKTGESENVSERPSENTIGGEINIELKKKEGESLVEESEDDNCMNHSQNHCSDSEMDDIEPIEMLGSVFTEHQGMEEISTNVTNELLASVPVEHQDEEKRVEISFCDDRLLVMSSTKDKIVTPKKKFAHKLENLSKLFDDEELESEHKEPEGNAEKTSGKDKGKQKKKKKSKHVKLDLESSDDEELNYSSGVELTQPGVEVTLPKETVVEKADWLTKAKKNFKVLNSLTKKKDDENQNNIEDIFPEPTALKKEAFDKGFQVYHKKILTNGYFETTTAHMFPKKLYKCTSIESGKNLGHCLQCTTCSMMFTPLAFTVHHDTNSIVNLLDHAKSRQEEYQISNYEKGDADVAKMFRDFTIYFHQERSKCVKGTPIKLPTALIPAEEAPAVVQDSHKNDSPAVGTSQLAAVLPTSSPAAGQLSTYVISSNCSQSVIPSSVLSFALPQSMIPSSVVSSALPQSVISSSVVSSALPQSVIPSSVASSALPQSVIPSSVISFPQSVVQSFSTISQNQPTSLNATWTQFSNVCATVPSVINITSSYRPDQYSLQSTSSSVVDNPVSQVHGYSTASGGTILADDIVQLRQHYTSERTESSQGNSPPYHFSQTNLRKDVSKEAIVDNRGQKLSAARSTHLRPILPKLLSEPSVSPVPQKRRSSGHQEHPTPSIANIANVPMLNSLTAQYVQSQHDTSLFTGIRMTPPECIPHVTQSCTPSSYMGQTSYTPVVTAPEVGEPASSASQQPEREECAAQSQTEMSPGAQNETTIQMRKETDQHVRNESTGVATEAVMFALTTEEEKEEKRRLLIEQLCSLENINTDNRAVNTVLLSRVLMARGMSSLDKEILTNLKGRATDRKQKQQQQQQTHQQHQ